MGTVRRWRGRILPRPEEELVDQGLAFDLRTVLDRRLLLRGVGASALAVGLAACGGTDPDSTASSGASTSDGANGEIPDETAGPYPGDGSNGPDVLGRSGIVRSDIRTSLGDDAVVPGVPMTLELSIQKLSNGETTPYAGVAVYVWHCNQAGGYSLYSEGIEDETYLRGLQVTDDDGKVRFTSVFPACYAGRWPHVHFEVYPDADAITDASNAVATSQVALPADVCKSVYAEDGYAQSVRNLAGVSLADDNVFGDDDGVLQLATVTGSVAAGYTVALTAEVDPSTKPAGGTPPSGGAPPGESARPGSDGRPRGTAPTGRPGGPPPRGGPSGSPPPRR